MSEGDVSWGPWGEGKLGSGKAEREDALRAVETNVGRLLAAADAGHAWGEPVTRDEITVLPAAEVVAVAGFGVGSGQGFGSDRSGGRGGGGGGGGRVLSRAVAAVEVSPRGVRVHPVVDFTKIALAALTAAGFVIAGWSGLRRAGRALRRLRDGA